MFALKFSSKLPVGTGMENGQVKRNMKQNGG